MATTKMTTTTKTCERCRAIEALVRQALGLTGSASALVATPTSASDASDLESRLHALVSFKRAYEQSLSQNDPDTVEHEHARGIAVGLQMAVDRLRHATNIQVDDPAPPKTRKKKNNGSNGTIARVPARDESTAARISTPPSPYALSLLSVAARRHPSPSTDEQIAVLSGRSRHSSSFTEAMSTLREDGFVEGPASARVVTLRGLKLVGERRETLPSGAALLALWQSKLERSEAKILGAIVDLTRAHALPTTRVRVSDVSRESGYSETSSSFTAALGKLRRLGLIHGNSNRCAEELIR